MSAIQKISTSERFDNRVDNYVRYRPNYPFGVIECLKNEIGLSSSSIVADVGSGTGLSSKLFLDEGCLVCGVEPNETMREAAERFLSGYENFESINGTAENTTLENESIDFVVAGQAFHWFDADKFKEECKRILKPNGHVVLIWNERQLGTTPFLIDYENLLLEFGTDYKEVRHDDYERIKLENFFDKGFVKKTFPNAQHLDYDGLKGRMMSASYMPSESHPRFQEMIVELERLFARHQEDGKVKILYDTNVFYGQV
jgi:SAM-dependent methyltransferase